MPIELPAPGVGEPLAPEEAEASGRAKFIGESWKKLRVSSKPLELSDFKGSFKGHVRHLLGHVGNILGFEVIEAIRAWGTGSFKGKYRA